MFSRLRAYSGAPAVRAIGAMATGAGLAQVIAVVSTPFVTRLYLPSSYGTVAVYSAAVTLISSVSTGRYDAAVTLPVEAPDGEREAVALVWLSLVVSVAVTALTAIACGAWFMLMPPGDLGAWVFAIPLGVLFASAGNSLRAYATRQRMYSRLAKIPPAQKGVSVAIQVGLGLKGLGTSGLMAGALLSPLVGLGRLTMIFRSGLRSQPAAMHARDGAHRLWRVARDYSDFPRWQAPVTLLNAASWSLQTLVLAWRYDSTSVGHYSLAYAILSLPASLAAASFSQVFSRELASRSSDLPAARRLIDKALVATAVVATPLLIALGITAPIIFPILFGAEWAESGAIATAMSPLLWARFMGTNVATVFVVYRRQSALLIWQGAALGLTVAAVLGGGAWGLSVVGVTWLVSALVAPMYLLLIVLARRIVRVRPE